MTASNDNFMHFVYYIIMKTNYMGVIFTKHAINRLYNRNITQSKAWETFTNFDGKKPGKIPGSTKFYKNYGEQKIEVVAKKNKEGQWVILSCWARYKEKPQIKETFLEKLIGKIFKK